MNANTNAKAAMAQTLKTISKKLPPGITAAYRGGRIVYLVRTSRTTENGTFKANLGTFISIDEAVRALVDWKTNNIFKSTQSLQTAEVLNSLQDSYHEAQADLAEQHCKTIANLESIFELLESVPFHELDASKDAAIANEDGTTTVVPASVVAAYFKRLQNT